MCVFFLTLCFGNCFITKIKWELNIHAVDVGMFLSLLRFPQLWGDTVVSSGCNVPCSVCPGPCTFSTRSHLTAAGEELEHQLWATGAGQELAWAAICILAWLLGVASLFCSLFKQNAALHALENEMLAGRGLQRASDVTLVSVKHLVLSVRVQNSELYLRIYQAVRHWGPMSYATKVM